jgi:Phenazine biosynthesis-like protein
MNYSRRGFLRGVSIAVTTRWPSWLSSGLSQPSIDGIPANGSQRLFHCVQIDVFTSQRFQGNQLSLFTAAQGLSDSEMQELARETNFQETTLCFPVTPWPSGNME